MEAPLAQTTLGREPPSRRATVLGLLFTALGAALAAGYLIPYKAATLQVGPAGVVLPMLLAAAVISTVLDGVQRILWKPGPSAGPSRCASRATLVVALILGSASALSNEAVSQALQWLEPGFVSVTLRTQVLFVALGGLLLLRESLGPRFWVGVVLALGAYAFLQGTLEGSEAVAWQGLVWALVAAVGFASMQLSVRAAVHRIDALRVNTLRLWMAVGLVALVPGRLGALPEISAEIWALAALAALCGPVLSRLSLMRALRYLPAAHATLALLLGPVFTYLLAGLVFGTWPNALEILGATVILLAVALPVTELPGWRRQVPG